MHHVDYMALADKIMEQIRKGAFLTVQAEDKLNVMTIGWASLGFMWGRPMLTIMVRKSRYTFSLIENASEFTVSVPMVDMSKELDFCGTKSGKKHEKLQECGMEIFPSEKIHTPILNLPGIHFECKIVYKSALEPDHLVEAYKHLYPNKDYHSLYYGEIMYCYSTVDSRG
jgi:flavin reductase (DIM6/NTAB) family NADH-FMN oxidoreductase RutF